LPIRFVWLASRFKITGFDSDNNCWIYSNEVESLKDNDLVVKSFNWWEIARWKYADIKDICKWAWGKFTSVIIARMWEELVKFEFSWSANEAWIEFWQWITDYNKLTMPIEVKKTTEWKTAWNKYNKPLFTQDTNEMTAEEIKAATWLAWEVDTFFKEIKAFYKEQAWEQTVPVEEAVSMSADDIEKKLKEWWDNFAAEEEKRVEEAKWELPF
jgi:hypothetical protein